MKVIRQLLGAFGFTTEAGRTRRAPVFSMKSPCPPRLRAEMRGTIPTRTSRNQTGRTHRRDAEGAEDAEISCSSKCNTRRLFTLRPLRLGGEFFDRSGEDLICKGLTARCSM